jgi:hypothetical protein
VEAASFAVSSLLVAIAVMSTTDNDLRPFGAVLTPAAVISAIMVTLDNHDLAVTAIPIPVPMMFGAFANPDGQADARSRRSQAWALQPN